MFRRGILRRCAWCGGRRAFFVGWFKKSDRCQTCGIKWERNLEGFELGSATMGVFITFGSIIVWMVLSLLLSVPLVPLLVVAAVLAVAMPILTYPVTYTVWFAVHLSMNELEPEELHDAEIWRLERSVNQQSH
jgi:uncharacterized protein (DUF983 family)